MRKRELLILLAVMVWAASFCVPAHAQFAALEGTVKGADGLPLAGAQILIVNVDRNWNYKTKTDKKGHYYYAGLQYDNLHNVTLVVNGRERMKRQQVRIKGTVVADFDLQSLRDSRLAERAGIQAGPGGKFTPQQRKEIELQLDKENIERDKMRQLNQAYGDGMEALRGRNYEVAIAQLEQAAQLDPQQHAVFANLGKAYMEAGKKERGGEARAHLKKSVEAYERAVALRPDDPGYHNNFGLALGSVGELQRAEEELTTAAQLNPARGGRYFYNLGAMLANNARLKEATVAFRKATELDPKYSMAWYQLGVSLSAEAQLDEKTGKSTPAPGTVEALQKYLELEPTGRYAAIAKSLIDSLGAEIETQFEKKKKRRRRR